MGFSPELNTDNRDPRVACAIVIDTSGSMVGQPIDEVNRGYQVFVESINEDPLARKRTEVCVVTFGDAARLRVPFTEGRDLTQESFTASGATPMGAALNLALDEIETRKAAYRAEGLEYYRPWLVLITDGAPTDQHVFEQARVRVVAAEGARGVVVFPVGVAGADMALLGTLSQARPALQLNGLNFAELFTWLSSSMSSVSQSSQLASSDEALAASTQQIALPPVGWATL